MKTTKSKAWMVYLLMGLVCAAVVVARAQVPIIGTIIDAVTGFTVAGAAPSGQAICGNGTVGVYSANCAINAATATTLASTPSQCSGAASGIAANGNANCAPATNLSPASVLSSRALNAAYGNPYNVAYQVCITGNDLASASTFGSGFAFIISYASTAGAISQTGPFISEAGVHNDKGQVTNCALIPLGWSYEVFMDTTTVSNPQPMTVTNWSEAPLQ